MQAHMHIMILFSAFGLQHRSHHVSLQMLPSEVLNRFEFPAKFLKDSWNSVMIHLKKRRFWRWYTSDISCIYSAVHDVGITS